AALFTCSTPSTAEARSSLSATAEKDYCMVKPTSPQKCDINDMFLSMLTWASPPAGHSLPTSVTSPLQVTNEQNVCPGKPHLHHRRGGIGHNSRLETE
ncbi:hypothetical protein V5799_032355, partial [Amblyomma americanum]